MESFSLLIDREGFEWALDTSLFELVSLPPWSEEAELAGLEDIFEEGASPLAAWA